MTRIMGLIGKRGNNKRAVLEMQSRYGGYFRGCMKIEDNPYHYYKVKISNCKPC
jgi:hypothetical protein